MRVSPDIILYLAFGITLLAVVRTALPGLRRRRQAAVDTAADLGSLSASVRSQVARDFKPEERDEVQLVLAQYGTSEPETEQVQLAILHLAKGNKTDVASHVSAARQDYRDVLYWAYYYDDDPHRLLRELLTHLQEAGLLSRDEAQAVLRATRGPLYHDAFEKLCEILVRKDTRLTRDAYQRVERLGMVVKQPAQLWAPLEKNVI